MRFLRLLRLKFRRYVLREEIETVEELITASHHRRIVLYAELKRVQTRIAMTESAANLLREAVRNK